MAPRGHVGELRDRRIGEPGLQVVLVHRDERGEEDRARGDPDERRRRPRRGEEVDAEDVDDDLQDAENARLHDGDGVEEGRHRRRRHHGVRQPGVGGHQRRLADAVGVEEEERDEERRRGFRVHGEEPARRELRRPGDREGPGDRGEEKADRGAHQDAEVDAAPALRVFVALVGDEREGRERQDLVEDEQRKEVRGVGDAERRADGDGEAHVKARLPRLVVAAHVADRIDRIDEPEPRGDQAEHRAEGLDLEGERRAGDDLEKLHARTIPRPDRPEDEDGAQDEKAGRRQRHRLPQVGVRVEARDGERREKRQEESEEDRGFGGDHCAPRISASAARVAIPPVSAV